MKKYAWVIAFIAALVVFIVIISPNTESTGAIALKCLWSAVMSFAFAEAISGHLGIALNGGSKASTVRKTLGISSNMWVVIWSVTGLAIMLLAVLCGEENFSNWTLFCVEGIVFLICMFVVCLTNFIGSSFGSDEPLTLDKTTVSLENYAKQLELQEARLMSMKNPNQTASRALSRTVKTLKEKVRYSNNFITIAQNCDYPLEDKLGDICKELAVLNAKSAADSFEECSQKIAKICSLTQ